jgi:sugar/nucleoside kinase (ribokinase family)
LSEDPRLLRVACVGVFIVDCLGRPIDDLPRGQVSRIIDEIRLTVAGTAGGTAVDLARLGAEVLAVGAVGTDNLGKFLVDSLRAEGVQTRYLVCKDGAQTSATILPISSTGERPAWHVVGANGLFDIEDVPWSTIASCHHVHLGGISAMPMFDGEPSVSLLRFAKENGVVTSADCLGVKRVDTLSILEALLPYVDIFMPNDAEASKITGLADPAEAAQRLHDLGASTVMLTLGEQGCLVLDESGYSHLRAFPGPVVDSTGCGDAFSAGVIVGLFMGWSSVDAARLGLAAASLTLAGLGSDAGIQSLAATLQHMETGAET